MFEALRYVFQNPPKANLGNAQAYAYQRTQAPPEVYVAGPGRVVQRSMQSLEGAYILLGYGTAVNATVASSLGINSTPGLNGLTRQDNYILGG